METKTPTHNWRQWSTPQWSTLSQGLNGLSKHRHWAPKPSYSPFGPTNPKLTPIESFFIRIKKVNSSTSIRYYRQKLWLTIGNPRKKECRLCKVRGWRIKIDSFSSSLLTQQCSRQIDFLNWQTFLSQKKQEILVLPSWYHHVGDSQKIFLRKKKRDLDCRKEPSRLRSHQQTRWPHTKGERASKQNHNYDLILIFWVN